MKYDLKPFDAVEVALKTTETRKKESKCKSIIGCYLGEDDDHISITYGMSGGKYIIPKENILYIIRLGGGKGD